MPIIRARYNTNTIHLAVNPIHSFYFMCHFKAFTLLRFYLLKCNDTIIVQSGVFVNTDRHKKSHRKGRFCGSFFGENHEVYLCKTFCAKHSTCRGELCSPAFFTHESLALSYHRSSWRSLSPAVIQRHIVTTPTKPPTSVPAKNSSIKTPPADSVDILEWRYSAYGHMRA